MFISNISELWGSDDSDPIIGDEDGERRNKGPAAKTRPGSSMIIEDASPTLSWKESSHSFAPHGSLSSSQRFSMDAISDGGKRRQTQETRVGTATNIKYSMYN